MKVKNASRYRTLNPGIFNSPYSSDLMNEIFIHSAGLSKAFIIKVKPNLRGAMRKVTKNSAKQAKKLCRYYQWSTN